MASDIGVVADPISAFPAVAGMADAAGLLQAILMILVMSTLYRREKEDSHEVGPRRVMRSARIASYSDMTGLVSLRPGADRGLLRGTSCGVAR